MVRRMHIYYDYYVLKRVLLGFRHMRCLIQVYNLQLLYIVIIVEIIIVILVLRSLSLFYLWSIGVINCDHRCRYLISQHQSDGRAMCCRVLVLLLTANMAILKELTPASKSKLRYSFSNIRSRKTQADLQVPFTWLRGEKSWTRIQGD